MPSFFKTLHLSLLILGTLPLFSQNKVQEQRPQLLEAITLDTVERDFNSDKIRVLWLQDTLRLTLQHAQVKIDTALHHKLQKRMGGTDFLQTREDTIRFTQRLKDFGQNCYSYALEYYFKQDTLYRQEIFNKRTSMDRPSIENILDHYFKAMDHIPTHPKRNLKQSLPNDVVLAFLNKSDWVIHLVYYNEGVFYTKNGGFAPSTFSSLKKFLKDSYWDTQELIVYRLDEEKIN